MGTSRNYQSQDLDALLDQLQITIPRVQRRELLRQILRHASERAINLYLFYDVGPTLVGNRVHGVESGTVVTGAHLWTVG